MSIKHAHTLIINIKRKKSENLDLLAKNSFLGKLIFGRMAFDVFYLKELCITLYLKLYFHGPSSKKLHVHIAFWLVCLCILNFDQMVLNNSGDSTKELP